MVSNLMIGSILRKWLPRTALVLLSLGVILLVAGVFEGELTQTQGSVAAAGLQALASIFLIWVTMKYTDSTKENVELANRRAELELRQDHSETLRKRVEKWLGERKKKEWDGGHRITYPETTDLNIPKVGDTSVESAPRDQSMELAGKNQQFRVIPESLEEDPYFEDLIKHHATTLGNLKQRIESRYQRFVKIREEFATSYDEIESIDALPEEVTPEEEFEQWLFDFIILLERGKQDKDGLKKRVRQANDDSAFGDGDMLYCAGSQQHGKVATATEFIDSSSRKTEKKTVEGMESIIDDLDNYPAYEVAREAAEVLDQMETDCDELERKLIEYKDKLVYSGSCEYLREADITD